MEIRGELKILTTLNVSGNKAQGFISYISGKGNTEYCMRASVLGIIVEKYCCLIHVVT